MTMPVEWTSIPQMSPQSPVLALLPSSDGLWAGGIGALARQAEHGGWEPRVAGLALRSVLVLSEVGSTLLAAGAGGVTRSVDRGASWYPATGTESHNVVNLAISPDVEQDSTILAGTLDAGILRSSDGGTSWSASSFGMESRDILALLWLHDQTVLASTAGGVYRSTNGGRAWRLLHTHVLPLIHQGRDSTVAIGIDGAILKSMNAGESWDTLGHLPANLEPQVLVTLPDDSLLVGTVDQGVFHSPDGAEWSSCGDHDVLTMSATDSTVYAGTDEQVLEFDVTTRQWRSLGSPPLFDYRQVHVRNDEIYVTGVISPPQRRLPGGEWVALETCPTPLLAPAFGWDGEFVASTPDGFFASPDRGETWQQRSAEPGGDWITLRDDGTAWMAAADGSRLVVTRDRGDSWSSLPPPFGVLPVVALQARFALDVAPLLLAATYDTTQQSAALWSSFDDGATWKRGSDASTTWPVVATLGDPLTVSIGSAIVLNGPDGVWMRTYPGQGPVRRLTSSSAGLAALSIDGVWLKRPSDETWQPVPLPETADRVIDIELDGPNLFVLLTAGNVRVRRIDCPVQ
jgi:photosystem II stability/assembly factor-like uncharacterized protein